MAVLGLPEWASMEEIKRAYRRLALQYHPDRVGNDPAAQKRFIVVTRAYRRLHHAGRAMKRHQPVGTCLHCGEFGAVHIGLDGYGRCDACVLRHREGGRLLPLPTLVIVRCLACIVLIGLSVMLTLGALANGDFTWGLGGFLSGWAALIALAWTCISVEHCARKRRCGSRDYVVQPPRREKPPTSRS